MTADRHRPPRSAFALAPALALAVTLGAAAARAEDDDDYAAAPGPAEATAFQLSYGAAIVSEYIDDGETQSNGNPALQGYVEGSYGPVFAGIWTSTVDFEDGDDNVEFDLYAGLRHEFGDLELALSYYRYIYDKSGDCCGEVQFEAEYAINDAFSTEFEASWDPDEESSWTEIGVSYAFAEKWTLWSNVGTDFGTEDAADEEDDGGSGRDTVAMEFGISRQMTDAVSLSAFYHDSNENPEGVVVTLAADF